MKIDRDHPNYTIKIEPEDKTILRVPFGDVPFTQKTFEFEYSDEVKESDIPEAIHRVFSVDLDTVMRAWDEGQKDN